VLLGLPAAAAAEPDAGRSEVCTYRTYAWDVKRRRAVDHRLVEKPRAELTDEERDPAHPACSVCREDQVEVRLEGLKPFSVCHVFADRVRSALERVRASGAFDLKTVTGYRPGRTRGRVVDGRRTRLSNHSFGTAIDVNARHNGLYGDCRLDAPPRVAKDIARCKLRMGGTWDPARRPRLTVVRDGPVYRELTRFWRWGGDLPGKLKDFMHFSVTGE